LAHELLSPMGGATAHYHIALARVKLQKRELEEAEESLNEALQFDYQVKGFLVMLGKFRVDGSSVWNLYYCWLRSLAMFGLTAFFISNCKRSIFESFN